MPSFTTRHVGLFVLQLLVAAAGLLAMWVVIPLVFGMRGTVPIVAAGVSIAAMTIWVLWDLDKRKVAPADPGLGAQRTMADLTDSRRQIVAAFEIERRRIERDLHDGAQQYFVASAMKMGDAASTLRAVHDAAPEPYAEQLGEVGRLLSAAQDDADRALAALRETVAGIHPRVLSDIGLPEAINDVIARTGLRATLTVPHPLPQLPEGVLATAYFFASEVLTNVAKHAPDATTSVLVAADRYLHVTIVDDGPGGAVMTPGRGLAGMRERLAAFGGEMELSSPSGGPTTVTARIPLLLRPMETGVVV